MPQINTSTIIIFIVYIVTIFSLIICTEQPVKDVEEDDSNTTLSVVVTANEEGTAYTYDLRSEPIEYGATIEEHVIKRNIAQGDSEINVALKLVDLITPSNVTSEELEAVLKYDLKPLAEVFIEAENTYGVNAVYLASISALESGWGRYQFKDNNIFGFGNMDFNSEENCILYVAEFLSREYLSEDGRYYHGGYTLSHINKSYNGGKHWLTEVTKIAEKMALEINKNRNA